MARRELPRPPSPSPSITEIRNSKFNLTRISFESEITKSCCRSPLGYEHYDEVTITRQVVIGGKNKYLINGSNVQNNRVQDFFRSVQLNVNNPHFLIMQGRITKVRPV